MSDCPNDLALTRFIDRTLSASLRRGIETHLPECRYCCVLAGELARVVFAEERRPARINVSRAFKRALREVGGLGVKPKP